MAQVRRVRLRGYKSIRELDVELGPLNVLIGANGAGKSNFLSFFRMLNALGEGALQAFVGRQGGANALLHFGRKRTPTFETALHFDVGGGTHAYALSLVGAAHDQLMFASEVVSYSRPGEPSKDHELGGGRLESRLPEAIDGGDETALTVKWNLDRWRVYHVHDTSIDAPIKQKCPIGDNRFLRTDGGNLAAFLYMLRASHPQHYAQIRATIQLAAPFFDDFVLAPDALNPSYISLEWRERDESTPLFAHNLSDGTLRFMALTTVLMQPDTLPTAPHTILIDEPELGLHPYAITLLASMMRAASKKTQLIVSTQSVNLLDDLAEPSEVIVVERAERQSIFKRLDAAKLAQWLDDYSLGELWEKNLLGGRP